MALMNGDQYRESLRKLRPNMYKWGELIEDVTTHPATRLHVQSVADSYDAAFDPERAPLFTAKSPLTGETAHRWNTLMNSMEAVMGNSKMKRAQFQRTGTCQGATCAGWTGINVLWAITYEMDRDLGTNYHERVKKYFKHVEDNCLALAGAITDAKGNRSLKPSEQPNKDSNLHVKEVRPDGIVIRGYKAQICGVAACHEIIAMSGSGYGEANKDFCLAVAVPRDAEGLTIVETRRPSDSRDEEEGWDAPKAGNITQAFLISTNCRANYRFSPQRRVQDTGKAIGYFTAIYRAAIGACVAGQGDVMCGAAINMARANGLSQKAFQDKLNQMAINNEITYSVGLGAMLAGKGHPSGLWIPDMLLAHVKRPSPPAAVRDKVTPRYQRRVAETGVSRPKRLPVAHLRAESSMRGGRRGRRTRPGRPGRMADGRRAASPLYAGGRSPAGALHGRTRPCTVGEVRQGCKRIAGITAS
jgi:4-hydroxybutyryl-CoA dehydratase/vinylacetyl-CoA-Delta-isomerase